MRALLTIPTLLAAQALARKSLSIGTHLPHAYYSTEPASYIHDAAVSPSDPHSVANAFLHELLGPNASYVIRDDSYTDTVSGIAHIYARQRVNGLDVADGHINLNIRNGVVLSHGNSFYNGPQLSSIDGASSTFDPYLAFCNDLQTRLDGLLVVQNLPGASQVPLSLHSPEEARVLSKRLGTYCAHAHTASNGFQELEPNVETALLHFLVVATADPWVSEAILEHPQQHIQTIEVNALQEPGSYSISGVPGTIDDVIARLVYVQVPDDAGNIVLVLAHRFRVNLPVNSYEAYVSVSSPHRILSVVDYTYDGDPDTDILKSSDGVPASFTPRQSVNQDDDSEADPIPIPLPDGAAFTYNVFKWGYNDPQEALAKSGMLRENLKGAAASVPSYDKARTLEMENNHSFSSPVGWHMLPNCMLYRSRTPCWEENNLWNSTRTTIGNNVLVQENWRDCREWCDNKRPFAGPGLSADGSEGDRVFDFPYEPVEFEDDAEKFKNARLHMNASATQAFYTANMAHDLFYQYGFNEAAGSFQQWNFNRGGKHKDAVVMYIQIGDTFNWGSMDAPEDGKIPILRLSLYNQSNPYHDSAMSAGVVIHELTHGLTSRLAGGPGVPGCLLSGESKGMSEGWSDYVETIVHATNPHADYVIGAWLFNDAGGGRRYPYTLDCQRNPTTYESVAKFELAEDADHDIGNIWAEMLWTASAHLADKHGFSPSLFPPALLPNGSLPSSAFEGPDSFYLPRTVNSTTGKLNPPVPRHGNTLMLQLLINGLKLMECPVPSFFAGRNTIIEADKHLTGGDNYCELWAAFAKRGLGCDAEIEPKGVLAGDVKRTDGFKVPEKCLDIAMKLGEPCAEVDSRHGVCRDVP